MKERAFSFIKYLTTMSLFIDLDNVYPAFSIKSNATINFPFEFIVISLSFEFVYFTLSIPFTLFTFTTI